MLFSWPNWSESDASWKIEHCQSGDKNDPVSSESVDDLGNYLLILDELLMIDHVNFDQFIERNQDITRKANHSYQYTDHSWLEIFIDLNQVGYNHEALIHRRWSND